MIGKILADIRRFSLDMIAPRTCPCCGARLSETEDEICLQCLVSLPRTGYAGLRTPLRDFVDNGSGEPGFCAAWFFYDHTSDFADIIRSAKFDDRPAFARALGRLYARELLSAAHVDGTPGHLSDVEILMPVPMHWSKLLGRGYNQSREIALGISEVTGIPVADNLMARKPHRTQSLQNASRRRDNLVGKLEAIRPDELDGAHIAIVDDVVTTGATVRECVRALSVSGACPASIGLIALARSAN